MLTLVRPVLKTAGGLCDFTMGIRKKRNFMFKSERGAMQSGPPPFSTLVLGQDHALDDVLSRINTLCAFFIRKS